MLDWVSCNAVYITFFGVSSTMILYSPISHTEEKSTRLKKLKPIICGRGSGIGSGSEMVMNQLGPGMIYHMVCVCRKCILMHVLKKKFLGRKYITRPFGHGNDAYTGMHFLRKELVQGSNSLGLYEDERVCIWLPGMDARKGCRHSGLVMSVIH